MAQAVPTTRNGKSAELNYGDVLSVRMEKMVNNELLSDVTFIVGPEKQSIYAHKVHLLVASEYFYKLLCGNFVEAQQREVVLEDVDPEIFLMVLRLVYCRKAGINCDNSRAIYDCMQKFLLMDYFDPLISFLHDQIIDPDTAMKIFLENDHFNFEKVDEKCMHYIANNPLYFFGKEEFTSFPEGRLKKILETKRINCTDEQLEQALDTWLSANPQASDEKYRAIFTGTSRSAYSHRLHLLGNTACKNLNYFAEVNLKLTSSKPLSLYGFGIYLPECEHSFTIEFYKKNDQNGYVSLRKCDLKGKPGPGIEIIDVMFKEVVLKPNEVYHLKVRQQKNVTLINLGNALTLVHNHIKLVFDENYVMPPIAYIYAKYSDCDTTRKDGKQLCCSRKCSSCS